MDLHGSLEKTPSKLVAKVTSPSGISAPTGGDQHLGTWGIDGDSVKIIPSK